MSWASKLTVLAWLIGLLCATTTADAQNDKVPTIKEVMGKLNNGRNSLCPKLGKALKADAPNWDDIQTETKTFLALAEALPKNDPPRGDKTSWDKLTKTYIMNVKALDEAVQKKDKAAAVTAHAKIANSVNCNSCHKSHRG